MFRRFRLPRFSKRIWTVTIVLLPVGLIGTVYSDSKSPSFPTPLQEKIASMDVVEKYTQNQVSLHNTAASFWVTFNNNVYDLTDFISIHPGGEMILKAGGRSIKPFWDYFKIHYETALPILEMYKIGELKAGEVEDFSGLEIVKSLCVPCKDVISKDLVVHSQTPLNAETPSHGLLGYITPISLFYKRNHGPCPPITDYIEFELPSDWFPNTKSDLETSDESITPTTSDLETSTKLRKVQIKIDELKQLPKVSLAVTLQCAGNRRDEMDKVLNTPSDQSDAEKDSVVKSQAPLPVRGIKWRTGAISNALWGGVLLSDVFEYIIRRDNQKALADGSSNPAPPTVTRPSNPTTSTAAKPLTKKEDLHIHFESFDGYNVSIPLVVMGDTILAYEMNGMQVPAIHGGPIRVIVPGVVAARSIKWPKLISVRDYESQEFFQKKDYKLGLDKEKKWSLLDVPVNSALVSAKLVPNQNKTNSSEEMVLLEGYAISGGGRGIIRVEVSLDGGNTWNRANLKAPHFSSERGWNFNETDAVKEEGVIDVDGLKTVKLDPQNPYKSYAWTQWYLLAPPKNEMDVVVRAIDVSSNMQPATMEAVYNERGIVNNCWQRVKLRF